MNWLSSVYRRYLLPAFVIQSVLLAGGFGTGREIVEYFSSNGALGALLGLGFAFVIFSLVISMTFILAQQYSLYNYQDFFQKLIGRYSVIYEVVYVLTLVLVMSIVGSAAGSLLEEMFSLPYYLGVFSLYAVVCALSCLGVESVNRFLTVSTLTVYLVIIVVIVTMFLQYNTQILGKLLVFDVKPGWLLDSSEFALYNLAAIPGLLYCARGIEKPAQAVYAGITVGAVIVLPGVMLHLVLLSGPSDVFQQRLPVLWILERGDHQYLLIAYVLMLALTFCATIIGLMQGLLTRINKRFESQGINSASAVRSALVSLSTIMISLALSSVGLIDLIAKGYPILAYSILAVYVLPMLFHRLLRRPLHRLLQS